VEAWKETQAEAEKGVGVAAQGEVAIRVRGRFDYSSVLLFSNTITVLYVRCMILHRAISGCGHST